MIHRLFSSLETFKTLDFHEGLNVLLAKKEKGASSRQTRNRAGKSSLVETVHFLTGAKVEKKSPFSAEELRGFDFGMIFDLGGETTTVTKNTTPRSSFVVDGESVSQKAWMARLGEEFFDLPRNARKDEAWPGFRSLFSYFARRQASAAFLEPEKNASMQQTGDFQTAIMYLIGLDWNLAGEWQQVRDQEKSLKELKKAAGAGTFGKIIGKSADLRTEHTIAKARLDRLKRELQEFQVLPEYRDLEIEANALTKALADQSNQNTIDRGKIQSLEEAMAHESEPEISSVEALYAEANIVLPELVSKRYEELRDFHESVVRNRREYLSGELEAARARIDHRERIMNELDEGRQRIMRILRSHGALDQFSRLQEEVARLESIVTSLHERFKAAETLEGTSTNLELERNHLKQRLRREFQERESILSDAILAYEDVSQRLYEDAGSMKIEDSANGPRFDFAIQGSRSKGIKNMQIFCFDMMLMKLGSKAGRTPGFLIHDSHLFDGVDGRQLIRAMKVGSEIATEFGFQYIVTLNEDDAFKEKEPGFDLNDYVLPTVLTDATDDGGLFGFRFD